MSLEAYFQGKKVLITSAGKGIGKALAGQLHTYGATVYAIGNDAEALASLRKEYPRIQTILCDLNDWDATREALAEMEPMDGVINNSTLNKLINNTGVNAMQPVLEISTEKFDEVDNICLKAVLNVCQITVPKMIEAGNGGSIVNVSTSVNRSTIPNCASYRAMKAALDELSKSLAYELGPQNIRVNTVTLGCVWTNAFKMIMSLNTSNASPAFVAEAIKASSSVGSDPLIPMEDVVNTVLYVLSDLSSKMSGGNIVLDAGLSAV